MSRSHDDRGEYDGDEEDEEDVVCDLIDDIEILF
jgi:hypothetical protein